MVILYSGNDTELTNRYLKGLEGLPVLVIGDEDLGFSAAQLRERTVDRNLKPGAGRAFLFVDEDVDQKKVQHLISLLNEAGVDRPLMAVRTQHNETWPLSALAKEISREERYFLDREELAALVGSFTQEEMKDPYVARSAMTAFMMLQKPELSEEDLHIALDALRKIRAGLDKTVQTDEAESPDFQGK